MKYGINLPNFGLFGEAGLLSELALEAEKAGWDGFFIWDHIARTPNPGPVVDPWIALAAIALNTQTIRMGALVTPLARRRPWKLARETISLDHLSKGRLIFAAGLGGDSGRQVEWENFGEAMDLKVRAGLLDEGLAVMTGLWSGKPFSYEGQHYQVKESLFEPTPVQTPRIPVWIAGRWPNKAPFRRAAKWDGLFPLFEEKGANVLVQLKDAVDYIRQLRPDFGSFDIVYCGRTADQSAAQSVSIVNSFAEAGATWWLEDFAPEKFEVGWGTPQQLAEARARIRQGPPGKD